MFCKKMFNLLSLLLLMTTGILTACESNHGYNGNSANHGADVTGADDAEAESGRKVQFSIAYAAGDPATRQAIAAAIKSYMQLYPHVMINDVAEMSSNAYLDWLKIKDAVGEFPDLVEMRDTEAFAATDKIVPLPSDLVELFDHPPQVEGKVWNAPLFINMPEGIIYSKKAYAAAGITGLPATYDEFLDIQEKLKSSGITPLVVGGKDIFHMGFWVNKFLIDEVYAKDPDWNSKRTAGIVSFTDDNVIQAMSDFKDLFTNYVNKDWLSTGDNETASILVSGKAAQLFSGTWMFSQIEEADPSFEYGFYAVPDRKGNINIVGLPSPSGWSLSAEAAGDPDKREAIKDFIRFFFAPEQYSSFLARLNVIPSTTDKITYNTGEQMKAALDLIKDPKVIKSLKINNWWGSNLIPQQFRNWYYKLLQEMVVKGGSVRDYMKLADAEYDRQVKENQP
ncbi:extracellular solute-binding protein [Paenibacillus sp. FSL L8-0340]|uniref:ABC transporter substrate-binding protein n=1 Tax=Paenibacillus sp. FSL L8-0340 TaxID=2954685 RepID=UPI0031595DC3